jgi:histidinol-phosphate phosphatase family protein
MKLAVILAGGQGSRLAAHLNGLPKPLAEVGGQPLLHRQLGLLSEQGFERVVILVQHRAAEIAAACGNGAAWGLSIEYIEEARPRGTAGAVLDVLEELAERFLVIYGDTVLNVDLNRFWQRHLDAHCGASLLVHPNDHPQDSDLVQVDESNRIVAFHPHPHQPQAAYANLVNGALYIAERAALAKYQRLATSGICDFAKHLFPAMLLDGVRLHAYRSREYIKDAGTPERLAQVNDDVASGRVERGNLKTPARAVFIDRDGTINQYVPYLNAPDQFQLIAGVATAIARLNRAGYLTVVLTNQPVVARGEANEQTLRAIHDRMDMLLGAEGAYVDALYYCPHHPDRGYPGERAELKGPCACRKPATGLVSQACEDLNIALGQSWLVGDTTVDVETARRAGLRSVLLRNDFEQHDFKFPQRPDFECSGLADAANSIIDLWPVIERRVQSLAARIGPGEVVAIGGTARSGKSSWASALAAILRRRGFGVAVIGLDGWLRDEDQRGPAGTVVKRYDMDAIQQFVSCIPRGQKVSIPLNESQGSKHSISYELTIGDRDVVILEGAVALMLEGIERHATHRIFLERSERTRYDLMRGGDHEQCNSEPGEFVQLYGQCLVDEMPLVVASRAHATMCLEAVEI